MKKKSKKNIIVASCILFFVLLVIISAVADNASKNYYLKDLKVVDTAIQEKSTEDNKYYLRVSNPLTAEGVLLEDSWVEVNQDFFLKHDLTSRLGLLVGNYDVFSTRYLGLFGSKGQTFSRNYWSVEEVYDTYDAALTANPNKTYSAQTTLVKKRNTANGQTFFVLNADGRQMSVSVPKDIFDKYAVNSNVNCEFEAVGDFIKVTKVVN